MPLSAIIVDTADWHVLFWVSATLAAVSLTLVLLFVPVDTIRSAGRLDIVGILGLAFGVGAVLFAIAHGTDDGWLSWPTIASATVGVLVLAGWGFYELKARDALVDLRASARPAVLLTNVASMFIGFAMLTTYVAIPQLLSLPSESGVGLGLSLLPTSLIVMPSGFMIMAMSLLTPLLARRFGAPALFLASASVLLVVFTLSIVLKWTVELLFALNLFAGLSIGLAFAAAPLLIMRATPPANTAAANGINALARTTGTTLAATTVGAVLAASSRYVAGVPVPSELGFRVVFALGAAAATASLVAALFIPRSSSGSPTG